MAELPATERKVWVLTFHDENNTTPDEIFYFATQEAAQNYLAQWVADNWHDFYSDDVDIFDEGEKGAVLIKQPPEDLMEMIDTFIEDYEGGGYGFVEICDYPLYG